MAQLDVLVAHQQHAASGCGAPPEVGMAVLWLGTCCCSFPHLSVCAAAAAEQAARLAEAIAPLPYTVYPSADELVSVGIQRLQAVEVAAG